MHRGHLAHHGNGRRHRVWRGTPVITNTPLSIGSGKTVRVDVDDLKVKIDDPAVFRAQDGAASTVINGNGLLFSFTSFGVLGKVVAGTSDQQGAGRACWLDTAGAVTCQAQPRPPIDPNPPLVPAFTQGKAIYLSGASDGDPLCAVFNDGSLWCKGTTPMGTFAAETQVAPPGSLPRTCN